MDSNAGYVVAGYLLTATAVAGYIVRLFARGRRARATAAALAAARRT